MCQNPIKVASVSVVFWGVRITRSRDGQRDDRLHCSTLSQTTWDAVISAFHLASLGLVSLKLDLP